MASEAVWILTALLILATIGIGVVKGFLGDSFQFFRGPRDFILGRLARYGDPFTMSLMGKTYVVINSPKTIKFVLSTAHAFFSETYPVQFVRLLRVGGFADESHTHFRRIILSTTSGEGLQKLVPSISSLAERTVKSWENEAVVNVSEKSEKFVFNVGMHIGWRNVEPDSEEMDQIRNEISCIAQGLKALPINFPGFSFHKALKAREALLSRVQSEITRRRKAGIQQDDILNDLMSIPEVFSDYDICSYLVDVIVASTISSAVLIPWVVKYLDDFPEARQRVQDEQESLQQKMIEDKSLTWFKFKSSMPYTLQVIYEVMRIEFLSISPRKANKDVDYNGSIFHKGSYILASGASLHFDPKYYPDPYKFNPSRFVEKPNSNVFLPFGQGPHSCPGSELAITETMFIIHHLAMNYSWKKYGHDKGIEELPIRKLVGFSICLIKQ